MLKVNGAINPNRFGLQKNSSTLSAVAHMTDFMRTTLDSGFHVSTMDDIGQAAAQI